MLTDFEIEYKILVTGSLLLLFLSCPSLPLGSPSPSYILPVRSDGEGPTECLGWREGPMSAASDPRGSDEDTMVQRDRSPLARRHGVLIRQRQDWS